MRYRKLEELLGKKVKLTKFNCAVKMGVVLIHSLEVVDKYEGEQPEEREGNEQQN